MPPVRSSPVQPPKLQEKPALGFVYFWSFNWLGEEVSLVKGDLTVGHCEFEGLRKKERKGFPLHPPQSRGPSLTKTQAPEPGPQCQPSWREPVNGEEIKSFMGTGEGFLSTEKKGLPRPGRAEGWAGGGGGFPGFSSWSLEGRVASLPFGTPSQRRSHGPGVHWRPMPLDPPQPWRRGKSQLCHLVDCGDPSGSFL